MDWPAERSWMESRGRPRRIANKPENTAERIGLGSVFHRYHIEHAWDADRPCRTAGYGMYKI